MEKEKTIYGYVNGKPTYSRDEFVFAGRGFGAIEDDEKLLAFAEKQAWGWQQAGHKVGFINYYLGDYALDEPRRSLTLKEYERLHELQKEQRAAAKAADLARKWKFIRNDYFADNSVEEVWEDKDGIQKRVMVTAPHGDACY